jgi:hypothetical protein
MNKNQLAEAVKKYGPVYVERGEEEILQLFEIDEISEADQKKILADIKKSLLKSFEKPIETPSGPAIKRPEKVREGYKLYDLYKVQKEYDEKGGKVVYTGKLLKVGKPLKVNVKIPEYRAEIFNEQSANTGEMLFPAE